MEITIERPQESFSKKLPYTIVQGKTELGTIGNGESLPLKLDPKKGELKIKSGWCGSNAINLQSLSSNKLHIKENKFLFKRFPFLCGSLCILAVIFGNSHSPEKEVAIGVCVFTILCAISLVTIWKDKWLFLRELK